MNLAELYSLTAGKKIDKIYTNEKFFPLPFGNKYVLIQPFSKPSKNYKYWNIVLDILSPILEKNGLKLLQVGGKNEPPLNNCFHTQGLTSWGQLQYLVANAELVLTSDSVCSHLAGHYDKSRVILISNNFRFCVQPFFGSESKQIILEPDRKIKNPSFLLDEGPNNQLDEIKPEKIASSVCQLLNLSFDYPFESVFFGTFYNQTKMVEMAPDIAINVQALGINNIIIRLDYLHNEQILINQMQICPVSFVTEKPINLELLKNYKSRISQLIYKVTKNNSPEFAAQVQKLGINLLLISELTEEEIQPFLLDYLDINFIHRKTPTKSINDTNFKDIPINKLFYRTNKITLAKQQIFPSKAAMLNNLPISNINGEFLPIINDETWYSELDYYYVTKLKD